MAALPPPTSEQIAVTMVHMAEVWKDIERKRPHVNEFRAGMQAAYGICLASLLGNDITAADVAGALREEIREEATTS